MPILTHEPMANVLPTLDPRIPQWDPSRLVRRNCPTCRGDHIRQSLARPDGLLVNECDACSTWYVSPAPDHHELEHFYDQYHQAYFSHALVSPEKIKPPMGQVSRRTWVTKFLSNDLRVSRISQYISLKEKRALDVGCGRGKMLWLLQDQGAKVYGVDPDPGAVEYVRACGFENIWQGSVDAVDDALTFDVITLSDVIEHPLDPLGLLSQCASRLNQGGIIMVWTPNADHVIGDPERVMFRIHLEHMQYFSSISLSHLCKQVGLRVLHTEVHGHPFLDTIRRLKCQRNYLSSLRGKFAALVNQITIKRPQLFENAVMSSLRGSYSLLAILQRSQ